MGTVFALCANLGVSQGSSLWPLLLYYNAIPVIIKLLKVFVMFVVN